LEGMTEGEGIRRTHIRSSLMRESLVDRHLVESTHCSDEVSILPDVRIIKIGGRSIIDRGKSAVYPLIEEIIKIKEHHRIIIGVGGGIRERHTYSIGLDLELPTGGLAMIAGAIPEQNALMLQTLLARHGGIRIPKEHYEELPMYLGVGAIPIIIGTPPYQYWEHPPKEGRIPPHGTDTGLYLLSEALGMLPMIFVKDVDGLYTDNPATHPEAELIPRISARELIEKDLPDLPIERLVPQLMLKARHAKSVRIINGLKPENLSKALAGEEVGTLIYQEEVS
jgi:molybdenum storage protein